ncbi:MAG: hypothetical protein ACLRL6_06355 [Clostridium sp.]
MRAVVSVIGKDMVNLAKVSAECENANECDRGVPDAVQDMLQ